MGEYWHLVLPTHYDVNVRVEEWEGSLAQPAGRLLPEQLQRDFVHVDTQPLTIKSPPLPGGRRMEWELRSLRFRLAPHFGGERLAGFLRTSLMLIAGQELPRRYVGTHGVEAATEFIDCVLPLLAFDLKAPGDVSDVLARTDCSCNVVYRYIPDWGVLYGFPFPSKSRATTIWGLELVHSYDKCGLDDSDLTFIEGCRDLLQSRLGESEPLAGHLVVMGY